VLEVQGIFKSYRGIPAVEDVSFRVAPGEVAGFLGPNGAGKSTTVKIITGLLRQDDGIVRFGGQDIAEDMVSFRAALGYVPEDAHLYTYLSGLEYLQLVGRLRGLPEALIERKAMTLLRLFHLLCQLAYLKTCSICWQPKGKLFSIFRMCWRSWSRFAAG
jgi:ABC-2 type transport system ATP-binding protein